MSIPLNILIVSCETRPGGTRSSAFVHRIARNLHLLGDRIAVVSTSHRDGGHADEDLPYEMIRADCALTPRSPDLHVIPWLPEWLRLLGRLARVWEADCILCGGPFPLGIFCAISALRAGIPYVVVVHGTAWATPAEMGLMEIQKDYALRRADRVIGVGAFACAQACRHGVPPGRVVGAPFGVDGDRFHPGGRGRVVRSRLGVNGHRMVLTLGQMVAEEGADRVIPALEQVLDGLPDTRYVIAGDGPYREVLRGMAQRSPALRDRVLFPGAVAPEERVDYYNACDVFAMPCRESGEDEAGVDIPLLEASACGRPVLAGRSGSAPDSVRDGYSGILVDPWDVAEVASGLGMLLADRDYARRLGENGLRRVREELSWEKVAGRVREEIRMAVERI